MTKEVLETAMTLGFWGAGQEREVGVNDVEGVGGTIMSFTGLWHHAAL